MKAKTKTTLTASWASPTLAERALAYQHVRIFGSLAIFILLIGIQILYPSIGPIEGMLITGCDIAILIWQRSMTLRGKPEIATWVSLVIAAIIGTLGMHLGGGFITLGLGVYLILILSAAFVFWRRAAAYWMSGIVCLLFLILAISEITGSIHLHNAAFEGIYDLETQPRLVVANIIFGLLLILITAVGAGGTAEALGDWNITLANEVEQKTKQLTELHNSMESTYRNIVALLANVIEARDQYTLDHSNRISTLAVETAKVLKYPEASLDRVRLAAILHDIGKIGVPDGILNKPGPLTTAERATMVRHPDIGADIVSTIDELKDVAEVVRAHQEKYDGTGYPKGLRENEIPLAARIIAVADAYIAMTDERPYKEAKSEAFALKELITQAGKQFDPEVVDAFLYVLQFENAKQRGI